MGFNENIRSRSRPHLRDYTRLWLFSTLTRDEFVEPGTDAVGGQPLLRACVLIHQRYSIIAVKTYSRGKLSHIENVHNFFFFFFKFFKKFWRTYVLFWGHWYPCFGFLVTSPLGFKARVGSALLAIFAEANVMYIPQDLPLVLHVPTS